LFLCGDTQNVENNESKNNSQIIAKLQITGEEKKIFKKLK